MLSFRTATANSPSTTPSPAAWSWPALLPVLALGALLRFVGLGLFPGYMYDEYYYVPAALSLLGHPITRTLAQAPAGYDPNLLSAPPFAKEIIALSIGLFGNHPEAWRLPSAVFGTAVPLLLYGLTRDLFPGHPRIAWGAAALAAVDGLSLSLSRIALLDSIALPLLIANGWGLWRVHQMLQGTRPWSDRFLWIWGIGLGLGFAAKWNGAQMILLSWIVLAWDIPLWTRLSRQRRLLLGLAPTFIALGAYLIPYGYAWPQGFPQPWLPHDFFLGWAVLQWQILRHMWHLQFFHPWTTTTLSMIAWARPTAFIDQWGPHHTLVRLWAFSDPFLIWTGLGALGVQALAGLRRLGQTRRFPRLGAWLFLGWWVLCLYGTWFLSARTKFDYYFAYTMPALIIAAVATLGLGWVHWARSWRILGCLVMTVIVSTTLYLLPLWIAYPMPPGFYHRYWWNNAWSPQIHHTASAAVPTHSKKETFS